MVLRLHAVIRIYPGTIQAGAAADLLAMLYFCVRSQLASVSGEVVRSGPCAVSQCGIDYKKPAGTPGRAGRPMFAAELGIDGSSRWLDELLLHGPRECLVRDIDSPQADPYLSTAFCAP